MRVLSLNGSLRRGSYNRRLLEVARRTFAAGIEVETFSWLADVPPYNEDLDAEPVPRAVRRLREAIGAADAVLIATPEYNASIPGVLKNAIDWASRPYPDNALRDRPVAVVGASTGLFGAVWAQAELRKVLKFAGARVVERDLAVPSAADAFCATGGLCNHDLNRTLGAIVDELVHQAQTPTNSATA